jgi:DNA-binding transcriptional MerR regulator
VSALIEATPERRYTIGEVRRELLARGCGRSATSIRRAEERGIVTPLRTPGLGLRLYSDADILRLRESILGVPSPLDAA